MGKKVDIAAVAKGAGKAAADMLGKAKQKTIEAIDQNSDGKFDMTDVSQIASAVESATKKKIGDIKESAEKHARELEKKALQPIFDDTLSSADFAMTKFIRVCEHDTRRAGSDVCKGSIGYFTDSNNLKVVNIYRDCVDQFGISFIPDMGSDFYYVDPCDRDTYIALDEYFNHLKTAKINELQRLAQSLGAKHFRVTYKEEKASLTNRDKMLGINVPVVAAKRDSEHERRDNFNVEIAAEMDLAGHAPIKPELKYLMKDSSVQNLIAMRMEEQESFHHQKLNIKLSNASGLKESDAVKIDAVLKGWKGAGNVSVTSEARNESRRYLEYEIDF